jgi:hypothetical protein
MKLLSGAKPKILGPNIFDLKSDEEGEVVIEVTPNITPKSEAHLIYNPKNGKENIKK